MNREQILQILYEMALVTGGETHVEPLITKTLQRLLYHTAFPCGVFLSDIKKLKTGEHKCKLEQVVGCGKLLNQKGNTLTLTKEFIHGSQTALITDIDFISSIFGEHLKYKTALRLPVNNSEEFILLSKNITDFKIPFERIFEPVLTNFSKTLKLCRDNERHTSLLELEISERKKVEYELYSSAQHLKLYREQAPMATIEWNTDFQVLDWNKEAEKMFGYTVEEVKGRNFVDIMLPETVIVDIKNLWKDLMSQTGGEISINENLTKDGRTILCEWHNTPLKNETGKIIGAASIVQDISERKNAEQEIIKAKEEAERANHAKSDFLSNMSHELRTPLNAILGFAQLMDLDDSLPTLTKNNIKEIINGGHHLLTLINDVLDLAKIESGHVDLSLEPVKYEALILECISLIEPIAKQNNIQIYNSSNPGKIVLRADKIRVKQVIINLLSNAVKYNRRGGQVNISVNLSNNNFYRISITDTGTGIKEKNLTKLFESFNRLDVENTEIEGTGIGLVITKHLVELMGGRLGVETEYGVGSTFWIELPKESTSYAEESISTEEKIVPQVINDSHKHNILYIEDNPANLKFVIQLLAIKQHMQLFTAHTASLGLELAEIKCPDLILLDINLPEMDGYKVLEKLRNNDKTRNIPVIAVSANTMPKDLIKAEEAGFDDYLTKPLDIKHFYNTVDKFLLKEQKL
jgi:PAS domain S-box-containing protein